MRIEGHLTKLAGLFRAQGYPDPYVTMLPDGCFAGTARDMLEVAHVVLGSVENEAIERETAHLLALPGKEPTS